MHRSESSLGTYYFVGFAVHLIYNNEPCHEKTCLMTYGNNNGADQYGHLHSLISTYVVHCLDSIICIFAKSKISSLQLVYVAEQV